MIWCFYALPCGCPAKSSSHPSIFNKTRKLRASISCRVGTARLCVKSVEKNPLRVGWAGNWVENSAFSGPMTSLSAGRLLWKLFPTISWPVNSCHFHEIVLVMDSKPLILGAGPHTPALKPHLPPTLEFLSITETHVNAQAPAAAECGQPA